MVCFLGYVLTPARIMIANTGVSLLLLLLVLVACGYQQCGRFPVDAANHWGACVTHHRLLLAKDRTIVVQLAQVPNTLAGTSSFTADGAFPAERLALDQNSGCVDTPAPCRVLLYGTNFRVTDAGTNTSVYMGLAPTSAVWDTFERAEINLADLRMTLFQHRCADACSSVIGDIGQLTWQSRSPGGDRQILDAHDIVVLRRDAIAPIETSDARLINRSLPWTLVWVLWLTCYGLSAVTAALSIPQLPWRGAVPRMLVTILALQVLLYLGIWDAQLLDHTRAWYYVIDSDPFHTFGWHLAIAVPLGWLLAVSLLLVHGWDQQQLVVMHTMLVQLSMSLIICVTDTRVRGHAFSYSLIMAHLWQGYGLWRSDVAGQRRQHYSRMAQHLHTLLVLWFEVTHGLTLTYAFWVVVLELPEPLGEPLVWLTLGSIMAAELTVWAKLAFQPPRSRKPKTLV